MSPQAWSCSKRVLQAKQNEISALKPLLTPAFIKGRIFTLDAMHTQTELCAKIDRGEGYYLLVAKDNQPSLVTDLADFFDAPPPDWLWEQAETWDKAHGRLDHRRITCSPERERLVCETMDWGRTGLLSGTDHDSA